MDTGNEETVVTEVRRESLRLRSRADDEYGERRDHSNQSRRESLRLRSRADGEYGERRDRSNKAEGNHCDCEAEQMMTSVVCSSNYCLTASIGEESME
ncbi:hypothetical protein [Enterococcus gallinarum]|nr:hypothetical protein [Enterococcus gallinarum]MBO6417133.1 hypothetical protein [Enterococcus gallinarum]MBO6421262.1 hypothetical protein [Enterococcus gallinarum]MUN89932.1 hypothetical protein [Enterococcus gallinarum]